MHYTKFKFAEFVSRSQSLVLLTQGDKGIKERLEKYGYASARIDEGMILHHELEEVRFELEELSARKSMCVEKKKRQQKLVSQKYMRLVKIARIAFDDDEEAKVALGLNGARERTFGKWESQVRFFSESLLKTSLYLERLSAFGIEVGDAEGLKRELAKLQKLAEQYKGVAAEYRMVVVRKNLCVRRWQAWLSDYIKIVRIAAQESGKSSLTRIKLLLNRGEIGSV